MILSREAPPILPQAEGLGEDNSEELLFKRIKKSRIKKHPNRVPSPRGWGEAMQELIDRLKANAGINDEQAAKALETIKDFVKEKFPMLGGAVDNMFGSSGTGSSDEPGM